MAMTDKELKEYVDGLIADENGDIDWNANGWPEPNPFYLMDLDEIDDPQPMPDEIMDIWEYACEQCDTVYEDLDYDG